MDIKPPPRPQSRRPVPSAQPKPVVLPDPPTPPLVMTKKTNVRRKLSRNWKWALIIAGALVLMAIASIVSWYIWALQPLHAESSDKIRVKVAIGDSTVTIANTLKQAGVVRSANAVRIYAELSGTKGRLKAGAYTVSPSQSIPDIITHLVEGNTDDLSITISPGITLLGIRDLFKQHGYSDAEITAALGATYTSPLFADKPATSSLEGYIFPETFQVDPNDDLKSLLARSFDELYSRLQGDGLIEKFKQRGLTVYQALTLASIIQKEESDAADQKQVAQVFFSRLAINMALESDPTFKYAAQQMGVEPSINLESPYNTRKYPGLPPGPIANMNYSALQAVADPAPGDFMYFVAGDDGKTYFAHTLDEHIINIKNHCTDLCN